MGERANNSSKGIRAGNESRPQIKPRSSSLTPYVTPPRPKNEIGNAGPAQAVDKDVSSLQQSRRHKVVPSNVHRKNLSEYKIYQVPLNLSAQISSPPSSNEPTLYFDDEDCDDAQTETLEMPYSKDSDTESCASTILETNNYAINSLDQLIGEIRKASSIISSAKSSSDIIGTVSGGENLKGRATFSTTFSSKSSGTFSREEKQIEEIPNASFNNLSTKKSLSDTVANQNINDQATTNDEITASTLELPNSSLFDLAMENFPDIKSLARNAKFALKNNENSSQSPILSSPDSNRTIILPPARSKKKAEVTDDEKQEVESQQIDEAPAENVCQSLENDLTSDICDQGLDNPEVIISDENLESNRISFYKDLFENYCCLPPRSLDGSVKFHEESNSLTNSLLLPNQEV